jgi:L-alanine-DL-glutamate epimerase-like enolase superfamily enzyme
MSSSSVIAVEVLPAHPVTALRRCAFGVESHDGATRNPLAHHLLVGGGPETRDGFVRLGDTPGLGVEIDRDCAKRYAT